MGLREYLQRKLASLARPWLLRDLSPALDFHLSGVQLQLPLLELDVAALNSALMNSSVMLLEQAQLESATLTFHPFRIPSITLEFRGLRLVMYPRPAEDSFWLARRRRTTEQDKSDAVSALDPEGAVAHMTAESLARQEASSGFIKSFFTNLAFRAIRMELRSAALTLLSNPENGRVHSCSIYWQSLTMEEGFCDQMGDMGGILGSLISGFIETLKKTEEPLAKACTIHDLALKTETGYLGSVQAIGASTDIPGQYFPSVKVKDILQADVDGMLKDAKGDKERFTIFMRNLLLSVKLRDLNLHGMDIDVPETALELSPIEFEAILQLSGQLHGNSLQLNLDSSKAPGKEQGRLHSKNLWAKAVERIIGVSKKKRLQAALHAGVLRRKYAELYETWLLEIGWGLDDDFRQPVHRRAYQSGKLLLREELAKELSVIEQGLSVEATVLARHVARCRVSATMQNDSVVASQSNARTWREDAFLILNFFGHVIRKTWEFLVLSFSSFLKFVSNVKMVYTSLGSRVRGYRHVNDTGRLPLDPSVDKEQPTYAYAKRSHHDQDGKEKDCILKLCRDSRAGDGKWATSLSICFQKVSFTVFGGSDVASDQYLPKPMDNNEEMVVTSGMQILPAIRLTLDKFFIAYHSGLNVWGLDMICGCLHGETLSAISMQFIEELPNIKKIVQRKTFKNDNIVRFLDSCPSPNMTFSDIKESPKDGDDAVTMTHLIWEKQQEKLWSYWADKKGLCDGFASDGDVDKDGNIRPFFVANFKSFQANPRVGEISSGLMECELAMGCLDCNLGHSLLTCLAPLLMQFQGVPFSRAKSVQIDTHLRNTNSNTEHSDDANNKNLDGCVTYYASLVRQFLSVAILNKRLQVSVAVECPKLRFSTLTQDHQNRVQAAKRIISKEVEGYTGSGSTVVLYFGLVTVAIWPVQQRGKIMSPAHSKGLWTQASEAKRWLKRPPFPHVPRELTSDTCTEHEQVGNNAFFIMKDAVLLLEDNLSSPQKLPLIGPFTVTLESSICRDQFVSLFGTTNAVSASAVGNVSALTVHSYLDEVALICQALESNRKIWVEYCVASRDAGLSHRTSPGNVDTKLDNLEELRFIDQTSTKESGGTMFPTIIFNLCCEVRFERIVCFLGSQSNKMVDKREQRGGVDNMGPQNDRNVIRGISKELNLGTLGLKQQANFHIDGQQALDMGGRMIFILAQDVWSQFAWGDGCQLLVSAGLQETKFCVADSKHSISEKCIDNFTCNFERGQVGDSSPDLGRSVKVEPGKPVILSEFLFGQCVLDLHGPWLHSRFITTDDGECSHSIAETDTFLPLEEEASTSRGVGCSSEGSPNASIKELKNLETAPSSSKMKSNKEIMSKNRNVWLAAKLQVDKIIVTDCALEKLIEKATSRASGEKSILINVDIWRNFESISVKSEGGLVVLHTKALSELVELIELYKKHLSVILSRFMTGQKWRGVASPSTYKETMQEVPVPAVAYTRSLSFPPTHSESSPAKYRRLLSAPYGAHLVEQGSDTDSFPWLKTKICVQIGRFSLMLARSDTKSEVPAEGLLIEMDAATSFKIAMGKCITLLDITRFQLCSLHSEGLKHKLSKGGDKIITRLPQFGSSSSLNLEHGMEEQLKQTNDLFTYLREDFTQKRSSQLSDRGGPQSLSEHLNAGLHPSAALQSKTGEDINNFIMENVNICCKIESVFAGGNCDTPAWKGDWRGTCSIDGFDIAITTSEVQLLLALFAPLSELSGNSKDNEVKSAAFYKGRQSETVSDHKFEIPNGAIVAIKDVTEHLYLAVESVQDHYHLIGVLHYSLVGDRALFRVKYRDSSEKEQSWFSLLSVTAKNADGEPFRVHFRPGSGLADISSVNDKSWELWHAVPYKYSMKDGIEEIDVYGDLFSNMVHLVNQKSKYGLALADGVPMMVKQPGNPFKFKIIEEQEPRQISAGQDGKSGEVLGLVGVENGGGSKLSTAIPPQVELKVGRASLTLLYETGGGTHFLPLLRVRLEETQAVLQLVTFKTRIMGGSKIIFEYFDAQSSLWTMIMYPVDYELFYRLRRVFDGQITDHHRKIPVSFFSRLKKVDIVVSEPSLDMCLFLIGVLDLAGPYTMRHSPFLANCCQVENHTGVNLRCSFGHENEMKAGEVLAWQSNFFLVRHMNSRRDSKPAKGSSSVALYLEKSDKGSSTPVHVSLAEPGIMATRTRLAANEGGRMVAGPMIVVEVSKQNQDGIMVTVSPMVCIHNASGLPLELRCRRPNQGEEGAVVLLEDGDVIDDSMGAFDAINVGGELRKALTSLSLGNFLLSIRPTKVPLSAPDIEQHLNRYTSSSFDWSEDVKGAKAVRVSGLFGKLNYGLKKTLKGRSLESSFGTVHCSLKEKDADQAGQFSEQDDLHFLVRTTRRQVPLTKSSTSQGKKQLRGTVVALQEQQELTLLPTIRVYNFLLSAVSISLSASIAGQGNGTGRSKSSVSECKIGGGDQVCMYVDLEKLFLIVKHEDLRLVSKPVSIGDWGKSYYQRPMKNEPSEDIKELDMGIDFGDNIHFGKLRIFRGDDGVLQVLIYTQYMLQNDSDLPLLCCSPKQSSSRWRGQNFWNAGGRVEWPSGEPGMHLEPESKISWLQKSSKLLLRRPEEHSQSAGLDLESFPGSTELSLTVHHEDGLREQIQLAVLLKLPSASESNPTHIICVAARFVVVNESSETILICQDGFQEDEYAAINLSPGQRAPLHARLVHGRNGFQQRKRFGNIPDIGQGAGSDPLFSLRFRLKESGWNWSGPVCASALGSFSLRIRSSLAGLSDNNSEDLYSHEKLKYAAVHVEEQTPSLIIRFLIQSADMAPYRIVNDLRKSSIFFHQKGLTESEVLEPGHSVGYAWDDLSISHKLIVRVAGTQLCREINLDKLRPWKSFRAVRQTNAFGLQLPFQSHLETMGNYERDGDELSNDLGLMNVGYEVCADGPHRVLRVCEETESTKDSWWKFNTLHPSAKMDFKVPSLGITLVEFGNQRKDVSQEDFSNDKIAYAPIICLRMSNLLLEFVMTEKLTLFQLKLQTLNVDEKWQGAPFAAMLRVHSQDHFNKGEIVLHVAIVISNYASNPNHVKYSSILLQAIDLNVDEDTLMKLVPFYRYSLADPTSPSRQIYFDRFEIHPIKIVASFLPGQPRTDYTSAQETLRALLHSVIKIPSIRGSTVELNGVLLSHALLTFRQLAIKCAQHYSWYAMRAIYIAKGSKLLPPAFASLFDDSAASSLDVFFDPSNGSIDLQGLTLGMFNLLSKGLRKRGFGGTSRYIGDLERTMKRAGSNILFAILTEVSDNVLKGAEAGGFDGMVNGFRRGVLNIAMEPSVLRSAVVKGGSSRRIKLDRSAGIDEMYIEGYLQAMLDALFKQDYLRVKVVDDQVLLKNLPPNSMLMDEIIGCVKNFLVGEGLLAGETSVAAMRSLRRLQGENERQLGPAFLALCEQLFVIFVVRALRNQTRVWLHLDGPNKHREAQKAMPEAQRSDSMPDTHQTGAGQQSRQSMRRVVGTFIISSAVAYIDGRLCRHIPNTLARQIVSGFLLSFVE